MESKLAQLKTTMEAERLKRDSARGRNPTGAVWRSARTDAPVNSSYVDKVLKSRDSARRQPAVEDAAAAKPVQPLLKPATLPVAPPSNGPAPFGKTRASFDWNPSASFAFGDGGGDYEDLLGPEGSSSVHEPPPAFGGGSLLDGEFDEAANAASFAEAVAEWRGGDAATKAGATLRRLDEQGGGLSQSGLLIGAGRIGAQGGAGGGGFGGSARVSGGCNTGSSGTGSGGALLEGDAFDEDASSASFAEALNAWRGGGNAAPATGAGRASRFGAAPAAPVASSEPTLADKVHALKSELGIPMELSLSEAVTAANGTVGLGCHGTLNDQVGRLLRETGVRPVRGAAAAAGGSAGASPGTQSGPGSPGSCSASRPGSARPPSRSGGMQTQTKPPKSFFEMLQEQKRKDGVL